ncbi:hypothetical protein AB9P05_19570 [Roseivirga sp. BDSF3-8]|uniref:hypothetical protein n=1 Tax=Roseivirga sp. BDSF3-8 TaxID=3241598 RepID=UPI0035320D4F
MNTEATDKAFKIMRLQEDQMVLKFSHSQYTDKPRVITDVYVPEGTPVEDREFHW